ncbi:MAG: MmcQ/YjbR family DNA-binding protein [Crocinitomicaceae bacterium]|nr:MmcQ/YjbR family DNA-binding protein [Crocinitomicaceae bacterium]MDG1736236.1 MmcQ/YjbR family DNA-binding protein [Crocinitomicaceae bacterium]
MTFGEFYDFCIALSNEEPVTPFDPNTLVFKKKCKIFALTDVERFEFINLKCLPEDAIEFRTNFDAIRPGYHMNKKHWNSVYVNQDAPDKLIFQLIKTSFNLV